MSSSIEPDGRGVATRKLRANVVDGTRGLLPLLLNLLLLLVVAESNAGDFVVPVALV